MPPYKAVLAYVVTTVALGVMLGALMYIVGLALIPDNTPTPDCFEDEVIVWEGHTDDHTKCVPLDDL